MIKQDNFSNYFYMFYFFIITFPVKYVKIHLLDEIDIKIIIEIVLCN